MARRSLFSPLQKLGIELILTYGKGIAPSCTSIKKLPVR